MHEGTFTGGPLEGLTYTIDDDPIGVLAADAEAGIAWLYDPLPQRLATGEVAYVLRGGEGADPATGARPLDDERAVTAAETGYAVVSVPGDEPTQAELDAEEEITDGE